MKSIANKRIICGLFIVYMTIILSMNFYCNASHLPSDVSQIYNCISRNLLDPQSPGFSTFKDELKKNCSSILNSYTSRVLDTCDIRLFFVDVYGLTVRILDKSILDQFLVKLDNGKLTLKPEKYPAETFDYAAQQIHLFQQFLQKENVPLLYVQLPHKIHFKDTQLPVVIHDYINEEINYLLDSLKTNGTTAIDIRQMYANNPDKHYQLFYYGDHHWQPEYALYAYHYIAREVKRSNPSLVKYFDCSRMDIRDYKAVSKPTPWSEHLGSEERRVGRYYLNHTEEITYLIPLYKTRYSFSVPEYSVDATGSLEDTFLEYSNNVPVSIIKNHTVNNRNRILLIRDSFSHAFVPFLANNNYEVITVDLRHYEGVLTDFIMDVKPDLVIIAYNPSIREQQRIYSGLIKTETENNTKSNN